MCKKIVKEGIQNEKKIPNTVISNFLVYEINYYVPIIATLTILYKKYFKGNYVIDKKYYKDLSCCFKNIGINIKPLLNKVIKYQRFSTICRNRKSGKKSKKSIPSGLIIISRRPIKHNTLPTASDIFFH
jgi:hypothetical protein